MSDNIEWIKYNGQGMPVTPEKPVQVQLRYEERDSNSVVLPARDWAWGRFDEIIAYRIVTPPSTNGNRE